LLSVLGTSDVGTAEQPKISQQSKDAYVADSSATRLKPGTLDPAPELSLLASSVLLLGDHYRGRAIASIPTNSDALIWWDPLPG